MNILSARDAMMLPLYLFYCGVKNLSNAIQMSGFFYTEIMGTCQATEDWSEELVAVGVYPYSFLFTSVPDGWNNKHCSSQIALA